MTLTRTQLAALVARNALIALLIVLLGRPAFASTDPPVSTNPPRSATDLPDAPTPREGEPTSLHITILDGEGALNNIRQRTAREPIVQVEDQNHKPVAGVLIFFAAHSGTGGASATFNGLSTLSVKTGPNGQAVAHGFKPNAHTGNFTINVSATYGSLTADAVIHQQNIAGAGQSNSSGQPAPVPIVHRHQAWKWVVVGGVVVGITLVLLLDRNSGTDISLGGGGVGHP